MKDKRWQTNYVFNRGDDESPIGFAVQTLSVTLAAACRKAYGIVGDHLKAERPELKLSMADATYTSTFESSNLQFTCEPGRVLEYTPT